MRIRLDPASPTPLHRQLADAIEQHIARGRPRPGARLPTVRGLAEELDLAPGTVAHAYRELEASGAIQGRGRAGTFVADGLTSAAQARLVRAARAYVRESRTVAASRDQALEAVREVWPGA